MKILVGIDEDPLLEHVLATLRWCVRCSDNDLVTVLHAKPTSILARHAGESVPEWAAWARSEEEKTQRLFSTAHRLLSTWGIRAEMLPVEGHAAQEILRAASERQVDLVVVGARGRQERGFLIGSVAEKVKALARADVLVVRAETPVEETRFRALLAVDGSRESRTAVESFARKMRAESADVRLLHVLELPLAALDLFENWEGTDPASLPAALGEQVDRALSDATAILREHGIQATTEVRKGPVPDAILDAAAAYRAHLIALGSRGLSGIRGLLLGSVTRRVVRHGGISVLVARPGGEAAE